MVKLHELPVIELDRTNIEKEWSNLIHSIRTCSFVSIDIEMSGLGNRKHLNVQSIDERYKNVSKVASLFSIVSLGLSCFSISVEQDHSIVTNRTFHLLTLCMDEFMVEADSIRFLLKHGFNFNTLYTNGIEYRKGNDQKSNDNNDGGYVRRLFDELLESQVAIVLHNGFIDLIFLYESFYAHLPDTQVKFVADLDEMFRNGSIYDTKYIFDFYDNSSAAASFLEFLFKKSHYENSIAFRSEKTRSLTRPFEIVFDNDERLDMFDLGKYIVSDQHLTNFLLAQLLTKKYLSEHVCSTYSSYGFCRGTDDASCHKVHNCDLLLFIDVNRDLINSKKRMKRMNEHVEHVKTTTNHQQQDPMPTDTQQLNDYVNARFASANVSHNAAIDAFMTGHIFLNYLRKFEKFADNHIQSTRLKLEQLDMSTFKSKVYLTGKDYPLTICKSNFVSTSFNHQQKKLRRNN